MADTQYVFLYPTKPDTSGHGHAVTETEFVAIASTSELHDVAVSSRVAELAPAQPLALELSQLGGDGTQLLQAFADEIGHPVLARVVET
jgi:hypothetical protein